MPPSLGAQDNIKVFVRCRPKSDKEIRDHTPDILHFEAIQSREMDVKDNRGTVKRYTFDKVFSPLATQEIVYHDVARPILREVLEGYNCTIFAYGQTGTGKTYTMEGDISMQINTPNINMPSNAGLIPRTLVKLFEEMHLSQLDYTIKLSCMELYNEELYDLLALHPMSKPVSLSLYKDLSGSITAKGLEEAIVENAADAMRKVSDANAKRRVAATALNAVSSRSHCIFSITVIMRETTSAGEELVKTGKLNLVDLAGSENVSRSRAQDLQLREASMINKSLLNLGRVINALVRRDSHVPYRDSKLTRLLQESLGGRAKTAIIATVSPATSNSEETLSTLDYAQRAKNIQNRPEVNTKVNKKAVLQEYSHEIRQLRDQLRFQRDKDNGAVYLPGDQYDSLLASKHAYQVLMDSHEQIMQVKDEEMCVERESHQETKNELTKMRRAWYETRAQLNERAVQVSNLAKRTRDDRTVLMSVSQREAVLRHLIAELMQTLSTAASDVDGLHSTVDLARRVVGSNNAEMSKFRLELSTEMRVLADKLSEFDHVQSGLGTSMQMQVDKLEICMGEYHQVSETSHTQLLSKMSNHFNNIQSNLQAYSDHPFTNVLKDQITQLQTEFSCATQAFVTANQSHTVNQINELATLSSTIQDSYQATQLNLSKVLQCIIQHFAIQHDQLGAIKSQIESFTHETLQHLESARDMADSYSTRATHESKALGEQLTQDITGLISAYIANRNNDLVQGVEQVVSSISATSNSVHEFKRMVPNTISEIANAAEDSKAHLVKTAPELVRALTDAHTVTQAGLESHRTLVTYGEEACHSHIARVDDLVDHALLAVDHDLNLLNVHRSATVERITTGITNASECVASSVASLKDRVNSVRDSVTGITKWCRNNTMVSNCKLLVSRFTEHTQSIEASTVHFTRKRLRDPEVIPLCNKRQYHGPTYIPPPLNREQILEQVQEENIICGADLDGDISMKSKHQSNEIDVDVDPVKLVDQETIDIATPPRPFASRSGSPQSNVYELDLETLGTVPTSNTLRSTMAAGSCIKSGIPVPSVSSSIPVLSPAKRPLKFRPANQLNCTDPDVMECTESNNTESITD